MAVVSVVIPAYNRSAVISRALRSVLAQTWRDLELIVVDDGSTDGTGARVADLARGDSRVRLCTHDRNRGAQAARNTGIRTAQGEWIAFLDSDDVWFPDSLEVRLREAARRGVRVVHSECRVLEEGADEPHLFGVPPMQGRVYGELLRRPGPVFPSLLVTRDALVRIGYLDESLIAYQEWDTTIRLARHEAFAYVPAPTFTYDCRSADAISRRPGRAAVAYERVVTKHRWSILRHLGPKALAMHFRSAAGLYEIAGDDEEARRCVWTARCLWPFAMVTSLRRLQRLPRTFAGNRR
jgi:glycosyltransferase involved in cell wall biosynthesis